MINIDEYETQVAALATVLAPLELGIFFLVWRMTRRLNKLTKDFENFSWKDLFFGGQKRESSTKN